MTVTVLFFAHLAKTAGCQQLALELADSATVNDALKQVTEQLSALSAVSDRVATAVNMAYVERDFPLHDGDELALIPPVSGG